MEEEKYYEEIAVKSLFTSVCNTGGYTKHIHKHIRVKTIPVCIVSIVSSKNSRQNMFACGWRNQYNSIMVHLVELLAPYA